MESLNKLVNLPVKITYKETEYEVPKANLGQVAKFQQRVKDTVANNTSTEAGIVGYALFLSLESLVEGLTEEDVLANFPGNVEYSEVLRDLGFLKAEKEKEAPAGI